MPLYEYRCTNKDCETEVFEAIRPMKDRKNAICPKCGKKGKLQISRSHAIIDFREGFDPGLGQYVSTARERDRIVAERGLRRNPD